ncbi:MAG TPA: S1 RNA-binding domain-containing protein [Gemmatales bacterium]|nr:S1 RNA-binding domain-containing protein [Gemmatales bacterium]HMP59941.1 S1 RNA-binding domain-containing protein [Gemmatales bacterium]
MAENPLPSQPPLQRPTHPSAPPAASDSRPEGAPAPGEPRAIGTEPVPPTPTARPQPPTALKGAALLQALDAEIEAELEEAFAGADSKSLLGPVGPGAQPLAAPASQPGGGKKGTVVSIGRDGVFLDVGGRSQGVLPLEQFPDGPPAVGAVIDVHIEGYDGANGLLVLNRKGAAQSVDWNTVAEGMIVEARVTGHGQAGLQVEVNGIRGFIPISQIELFRIEDLGPYVNQKLTCIVTEASPSDRNLVLSRRALLQQERDEQKQKLMAELAPGQIRSGVVRNVKPFGAFIDLGGVDGLLPVGEISWARVENPEDVLKVGQRVDVQVTRIDPETKKLTLSMKQLQASPWDDVLDRYGVGSTITGKVTRLTEFGAFVQLEPGIEGLIHISEMATRRIGKVTEVVKLGQEVTVQVLKVDPAQRRLSLSLKALQRQAEESARQAEEAAAAEAEANAPPPKPVKRLSNLKGGLGGGSGGKGLFG